MKELLNLPKNLNELQNKVKKLYFEGNVELLNKTIIAIVGSRRPSVYTKKVTSILASSLGKRGVCVISGAAMGVDGIAHANAFPNTIAVMGNSLDIVYPKINKDLIQNMQNSSLLLSEYPPNTPPTAWSFVQRNRIVVALSSAVVIAQADEKSGSMHSANFALKLNKPLYVLPQRLDESSGTNLLLAQNKAKLINDIDEFCEKFGQCEKILDEILIFCKSQPMLIKCLEKYGDKIYEYELDGKLQINGNYVSVLV